MTAPCCRCAALASQCKARTSRAKAQQFSKAVEIIVNGLKVSLDVEAGGELAQRLAALYDYMSERLLYANLHNSQPALDEVAGLLVTLREAWAEIGAEVRKTAAA